MFSFLSEVSPSCDLSIVDYGNTLLTDNEPSRFSDIPVGTTVINDPGQATAIVMWREPTVADNSGWFTVTSSHEPGFVFGIGTTTVMYSAVDASGNKNGISFDITVLGEYHTLRMSLNA